MSDKSVKKVAFCTLGCKVNQYETDAMNELFAARGYETVDFGECADIYVINTCTVTNMADRKSRQMLHRAKKRNPEAVVAAVGCYVQAAGEKLLEDGRVDLIVGNNQKNKIVDIVEEYMSKSDPAKEARLIDIAHEDTYETLSISKVSEHTRAYIKIQDGCNQFCSYCIIPFARGRVRSRKTEDIVDEVRRLADHGYKEVVLTGIHISSYGLDFEGENYNRHPENGDHLLDLIEKIAGVDSILRIRLGSLEPRIITDDFARRLSSIEKVCGHFHLSLQSGCDATLARMNRHYTAAEYKERCDILRKYFDCPALTTDVIVGFPGETKEEFETTEKFLEEIAFAQMHIFKYSRRSGTKAAAMENQVAENIKTERSDRLLLLNSRLEERYRAQWRRRPMEILLEEPVQIHGKTYMTGHSKAYIRAAVEADDGSHTEASGNKSLQANEVIRVVSKDKTEGEFLICERID